jgi:ribosomal protein L17
VEEMRLGRGGKFMATYKATVISVDSDQFLDLCINNEHLKIPLTEDKPNEIKDVFNKLITHLKKGIFSFGIEEKKDGDLIYQVAKEYVKQLNKEIEEVYQALKDYQLLEQNKNIDSKSEVKEPEDF